MKFLIILLATAASLGATAPLTDSGMVNSLTLDKRIKDSSNCGLDMWQSVGQGAVRRNIRWLQGKDTDSPEIIVAQPGVEKIISCFGQVGFYLNVDPIPSPFPIAFSAKDLGNIMLDTFSDCYGAPPVNSDDAIRAFQIWGAGYNILARGNTDCSVMDN